MWQVFPQKRILILINLVRLSIVVSHHHVLHLFLKELRYLVLVLVLVLHENPIRILDLKGRDDLTLQTGTLVASTILSKLAQSLMPLFFEALQHHSVAHLPVFLFQLCYFLLCFHCFLEFLEELQVALDCHFFPILLTIGFLSLDALDEFLSIQRLLLVAHREVVASLQRCTAGRARVGNQCHRVVDRCGIV